MSADAQKKIMRNFRSANMTLTGCRYNRYSVCSDGDWFELYLQHTTYSNIVFIFKQIEYQCRIACNKGCWISIPAVLCGFDDVGGNVGNKLVCKTDSGCRYCLFPVRDLVDNSFFVETSRHVFFNGNFIEDVVKDD